jgi:hypothetical protein
LCGGAGSREISSERQVCRLLGQGRGTQRYEPMVRADEDALTRSIIALATKYRRYGYRRITALLRDAGWEVGKDRVQRIWRREGLKVPQKQRRRVRLRLNDGSCMRLRPERANHVWSYDFVSAMTHDGRTLLMNSEFVPRRLRVIVVIILCGLLNVSERQGAIGIGNVDDLIKPCDGVTHVLCIGQQFFALLWKGVDGVGQVALRRKSAMFLVRFPSRFH